MDSKKRNEPLQGWETKSRTTEIKNHHPRCPHCKNVLKKSYTRKWDNKKLKLVHIGYWCEICEQFIYKFGESPQSKEERKLSRVLTK